MVGVVLVVSADIAVARFFDLFVVWWCAIVVFTLIAWW